MRRRTAVPLAALALFIALALVGLLTFGAAMRAHRGGPLSASGARGSAREFLARYELPDGRVTRIDQGGDTVSEGQSYAMLMSDAIGERADFMRAWDWSRVHLQQPDGLLAYHWQSGRVVDATPASDADLDAAHALVWGARRFDDPSLLAAGRRIGAAILAHETARTAIGPVLTAGPWAVASRTIDPSYFSPAAFQAMYRATGDVTWRRLEQTGYAITNELTSDAGVRLPPDWAVIDATGRATPTAAPSGESPRYSYDALRVPVRMAGAGTRYGIGMAARLWHFFAPGEPTPSASAYTLSGQAMTPGANPEMLAGVAAAAFAAGDPVAARRLLAAAESLARRTPTYYGWALLALTQLELTRGTGEAPL